MQQSPHDRDKDSFDYLIGGVPIIFLILLRSIVHALLGTLSPIYTFVPFFLVCQAG